MIYTRNHPSDCNDDATISKVVNQLNALQDAHNKIKITHTHANRQAENKHNDSNKSTHTRTHQKEIQRRQAGRSIERADHSSKYRSEGHQNAEKVEWMHTDAHTLAHIETVKSDASGK